VIRVLIVDEVRLTCDAFTSVLEEQFDIQVTGTATTVPEAIAKMETSDVALVSTNLPKDGAFRLTRTVTRSHHATKVLIVGLTESRSAKVRYIEAGARGFVHRDSSVDDLLTNIRTVYQGEALISPEIAAAVMVRLAELNSWLERLKPGTVKEVDLTPREWEVLQLIARNYTNQDIADHLVLEVGTVKNHVHNILSKLGVSNRREAATYLTFMDETIAAERSNQLLSAQQFLQ
jgi:DNA-binding NarL/FixJ family response regulator